MSTRDASQAVTTLGTCPAVRRVAGQDVVAGRMSGPNSRIVVGAASESSPRLMRHPRPRSHRPATGRSAPASFWPQPLT